MSPVDLQLPVPVIILEDEPLMQHRLREILEDIGYHASNLLFAQNIQQAKNLLDKNSASLALVDLGLPDGNGNTFIQHLKNYDDSIAILVISAWSTEDAILEALKAGATGYVLKERDDLEVMMSIRSVLRGGAPIDPFIAQKILKQLDLEYQKHTPTVTTANHEKLLTKREYEILALVATGLSNKEIADQLTLSRYTVESHIKHIYRKLAVCTRTKAIDTARSLGLLD
ncbi:response regulator transcription factor [Acinetobacter larvae]|uniref:DNA-binding response regulator n=1 Tax=Acinetobacter larvae TaxID=1789224 RepID=A0A1B2M0I8_9GAMM|nr:response regulator transcription factor [Acinetobacter larvae]AOA58700.1 DNA-binding response regulator [Acinetobacter larvae]